MRRLAPIQPLKQAGKTPNDSLISPDESFNSATHGRPTDARARHACESCRLLKVRCLSHSNTSIRKCLRCARLNQECLMKPRAPRKPRKRTDARVGELERQVEALSAALGKSSAPDISVLPAADSKNASTLIHVQEHPLVPEAGAFSNASLTSSEAEIPFPLSPCGIIRGAAPQRTGSLPVRVSSGILTPSIASNLFDRYNTELINHFPLSLFSDKEDASTVRETKPTLFLAVITAAAGDSDLELHSNLHDQLAEEFAKRIVIDGERVIELVQALLVAAAFYHPPDAFEKQKFYQYIHMAATMTTDIGLGSRGTAATPTGPRESPSAYCGDELESNVRRRTLIASYMSVLSVARSLRRSSMIQSDNLMKQCIEALENSTYITSRDRQLIAWVKLECIMKEVTQLLGLAELDAPANVADVRTQCTIKAFEKRLESWEKELSPGDMYPALEITYQYSKMYLHEIALRYDGNGEEFRPPFRLRSPSNTSYTLPDLQPARLDCVIASLTSAHSLLDVLLQLPTQSLRVFPTVMYIRASYAIFILLKIYFISSAPASELGQILNPASVKIEEYLNRLISHMQTARNCRLTERFCAIFSRSRDWFRKETLQADWGVFVADKDLFEPLRLLTLSDEPGASQAPSRTNTPDLHLRAAAQRYDPTSDPMHSTDKPDSTLSRRSTATDPIQLDRDALPSSTETWQYPMPWASQIPSLDALQIQPATLEPQIESLPVEDQTQIPLSGAGDMTDNSFDLAVGFDFDSHIWDFEMGDINFEQT